MQYLDSVEDVHLWLRGGEQAVLNPERLQEIRDRLAFNASRLIEQFRRACGYSLADAEALWRDQAVFLSALRPGAQVMRTIRGSRDRPQTVRQVPLGRVLICLPANAPVPLTAILAASSLLAGNQVVMTRPAAVASIVDAVGEQFKDARGLAIYRDSSRRLFEAGLHDFDHVYFMGSSSAYADVTAACASAGCGLTFEGQGNGFVYVSETATLGQAAHALIQAKAFCNGRMCSAPNVVLAHEAVCDEFVIRWHEAGDDYPVTSLRQLVSGPAAQWLWRHGGPDSRTWPTLTSPLLSIVSRIDDLPSFEFFSPVVACLAVSSVDEAAAIVGASKFRLQVGYFGASVHEVSRLQSLGFCRMVINMNPADQDPLAPWGNYGLSGYSPLATFEEKLYKVQLVEGSIRG